MPERVTIIGLGNELLSDDGAGIAVLRALRQRPEADGAEFHELALGGLGLLDHITGCDLCIVIDGIATGEFPPGTALAKLMRPEEETVRLTSSHQIDLSEVLTLARWMGAGLPATVLLCGIEVRDVTTFHEGCTDGVRDAIPKLVDALCSFLAGRTRPPLPGRWRVLHEAVPERLTTEQP